MPTEKDGLTDNLALIDRGLEDAKAGRVRDAHESVRELAARHGILLAGKNPSCGQDNADLSAAMALRIEKAFGVSMDLLLRIQADYDAAQARKRAGKIKVEPYKLVPAAE